MDTILITSKTQDTTALLRHAPTTLPAVLTRAGIVCRRCFLQGTMVINTSYQKLKPFGSGDNPDKLLYHQALN